MRPYREESYREESLETEGTLNPGLHILAVKVPEGLFLRLDGFELEGDLKSFQIEDLRVGRFRQFTRDPHPVLDLFQGKPCSQLVSAETFKKGFFSPDNHHFVFDTALPGMFLSLLVHNNSGALAFLKVRYFGVALKSQGMTGD